MRPAGFGRWDLNRAIKRIYTPEKLFTVSAYDKKAATESPDAKVDP